MPLTFEQKYAEDVKRIEAYAENGVKYVEVYVNIEGKVKACRKCVEQSGVIYTIDEVLEAMPVPLASCEGQFGCRCLYLPVVEEPQII